MGEVDDGGVGVEEDLLIEQEGRGVVGRDMGKNGERG